MLYMKHIMTKCAVLCAAVILLGLGCSNKNPEFVGAGGMFLTEDNGKTWVQKSIVPTVVGPQSLAGVSVYRIYDDPQDPNTMYWASRDAGLFYTYNNGNSWTQAPAPLNTGIVFSVAVHPKNKCLIMATNGSRVYKSVDCSRSWEEVHREERAPARITSLKFHAFEPYELFMTKENGDVLVSSDIGISWTIAARQARGIVHIESDPFVADRLYISTRSAGLFRSEDRGRTWQDISTGIRAFPGALEYRRFYLDAGQAGHLYWISTYGILRSIDSGDTWQSIDLITSPGSAQIYGFTVNPSNPLDIYYVATIGSRSIFYYSKDGGVNWTTEQLPSAQVPTVLRIHPVNTNQIFLGMTIPPQN